VIYDTLPASNESQTMNDIDGLTHTFSNFQVFDIACVVAVQSTDTITELTSNFSYARNCFINAFMPPNPPVITNVSYGCNLFELQWLASSEPIVNIMEYIVVLVNSSGSACGNICDGTGHEFTVRREITSYSQTFEVSKDTCFCAAVYARNTKGRSIRSDQVSFVHQYVPPVTTTVLAVIAPTTVTEVTTTTEVITTTKIITSAVVISIEITPTITESQANSDNNDGILLVAIILAVVLVVVLFAIIVLGLLCCKMCLFTRETRSTHEEILKAIRADVR